MVSIRDTSPDNPNYDQASGDITNSLHEYDALLDEMTQEVCSSDGSTDPDYNPSNPTDQNAALDAENIIIDLQADYQGAKQPIPADLQTLLNQYQTDCGIFFGASPDTRNGALSFANVLQDLMKIQSYVNANPPPAPPTPPSSQQ